MMTTLLDKWKLALMMAHDPLLTRADLAIALVLLDMHNAQKGCAWPSYAYLAEKVGVSSRSAIRSVCRLVATGWFVLRKRGRTSNSYAPCWDRLTVSPGLTRRSHDAQVSRDVTSDATGHVTRTSPEPTYANLTIDRVEHYGASDRGRIDRLEGLELDAELQALADKLGLDAADQLERFKDHHRSNGGRLKDYKPAFRNWLRNAPDFARSPQGRARSKESEPPPATIRGQRAYIAVIDLLEDLAIDQGQRERIAKLDDENTILRWFADGYDWARDIEPAIIRACREGALARINNFAMFNFWIRRAPPSADSNRRNLPHDLGAKSDGEISDGPGFGDYELSY